MNKTEDLFLRSRLLLEVNGEGKTSLHGHAVVKHLDRSLAGPCGSSLLKRFLP